MITKKVLEEGLSESDFNSLLEKAKSEAFPTDKIVDEVSEMPPELFQELVKRTRKSPLPPGKQWLPHQNSKEKMRRVFQVAKLHKKNLVKSGSQEECDCDTCSHFFRMMEVNNASQNGN